MSKTTEVIRFEVMRSLKKPSFWIAAILIPVGFAIYICLASLAGYNAEEAIGAGTDTTNLKLGVYDEAEYLKIKTFKNADEKEQTLEQIDSKNDGISAVKDKKLDVFYYISKDFAETKKVEIYVKPTESSLIDDYSAPIRTLLATTAAANIDAIDFAVVSNMVSYDTTTYDAADDHVIDENEKIKQIIAPGLALVCFYILIVVLGSRLTAAMVEEKENRISELILTSIKPSELIIGKIISMMIVGIIQLIVLVIPMLVLYKIAQNGNIFPDWLKLTFDPISIAQYMILLIASYFLFTALCIVVGVISPTAKDANSYSGFIVISVILPIFFISALISNDSNALTYILSYFPPSAPIALLIRAIMGKLPTWEYFIGLIDIIVSGLLVAKIATYIFCKNAIEFTPKINFKKLFSKPRKNWK